MHAQTRTLLIVTAGLVGLAGCAPTSGIVTGVSGTLIGSTVPDIQYTSMEGKKGSFNKVRYALTLVAFSAPQGPACCWLDPTVVNISDQIWDLPVTVAQFSLPVGECPHGQGCVEACNLHRNRLISLCDAQRIAWKAYGRPAPGSLILLGPGNKVLMTGSLDDSKAIVSEARRLGQDQQDRNRGDRIDLY